MKTGQPEENRNAPVAEPWSAGSPDAAPCAVVAQSPAFICTVRGPRHVIELANERFALLAAMDDLAGREVREALPGHEWEPFQRSLDECYRTGRSVHCDELPLPIAGHDGSGPSRFVNFIFQPLRQPDGSVGGAYAHGTDVTDLVRARELLRASAQRWQMAINAASDGIWDFDLTTETLYWSPRCKEMLGYADGELNATLATFRELLHPDDHDAMHEAFLRHQSGESPAFVFEYRLKHRNGSYRWILARGLVTRDASGQPRRMVGSHTDVTDRKRVEESLRRSESRLKLAVDALGLGMWDVNMIDLTVEESDRFVQMLGLPPRTRHASVAQWGKYLHPDDVERARTKFERALAGTCEYEDEQRLIGADGVLRWVYVKGAVVRDATGKPLRMVGVCSEITARKRAEEALRDAERSYRAIFDATGDGLMINGADGRLIEVNPAACRMHGYAREEFLSIPPHQFVHPDDLHVFARFMEATARGEEFFAEARDVRKDGTVFPIEVRGTSFSYKGRPHVLGVVRDVTERKRAEEALRKSEAQFREIFEQTPIGMTLNDLDGRYLHVNPAYCRAVGYSREEILDPRFELAKVVHPEDLPRLLELQRQLIAGKIPSFFLEKRYVRRDRSIVWVRVSGTVRRDAQGKPIQFVRLVEDIDDRKRAEAELAHLLESERAARGEAERASQMKDEFLATLSHELRTPLNAILGWSQILAQGGDERDLAEGLRTIERNARAQTQIIEDLLDMSRIISGKIRLDVQRVDLAAVVQAAVETVRPAADAKGVRLHAVLDPLAAPVSGDPNRLQQVFWNLLSNAVKFTPRDGRVQVLLERVNSHLEVSVIDSGEGISPEFLPFVFDRFRQSDASTTRRHGGLGLGLAIVKQLVELHGGTVRAKSPGPGQGATFVVALPLTVVHPERPALERRHPSARQDSLVSESCDQIAGVKVLVVDDEPDARALVRRVLEDCGVVVSLAESTAEALERLRTDRPAVLVSDIGMPAEDGYALIRRVRALPPEEGGSTPAIALTAYARSEDRVKAITAGFQHHVAKPVEPAELIALVASLAPRA